MTQSLGEFGQLVLLAVVRLNVYGVPIADEIERRAAAFHPAAVYVTLRRLEQKGMLSSTMSDLPRPREAGPGAA